MEAELKEYRLQLESVEAALKADPDNEGLHTLANELKEVIALTETVIAEEQGTTAAAAPAPTPTTSSSGGKRSYDSRNNSSTPGINDSHTASSHYPLSSSANTSTVAASGAPVHSFSVGDNVLAKWTSGDNAFYPARITSITGSSKNPVYIVKFSSYNVSETLSSHQVKPLSESHQKKRKLDAAASAGATNGVTSGVASPTTVNNSAIISQPANINAALAEQSKKPAQTLDGSKQTKSAKRVKHQRELNESKNKWQAFAAKGVKTASGRTKKIGESSMFRTPEGVHGRVGFTGSGQPMRKELNTRGKHIYQQGEADEE